MPVPKNKLDLARALDTEFAKLSLEIEHFPLEKSLKCSFEGHKKNTLMSFHNLLSYLLGWGELVLKWNGLIENKKSVDWPETGFKWTELGELAQKFYLDYSHLAIEDLIEKLQDNHKKIANLIASCSNKQLYETAWYKHYTMGKMIQLNTSSPYKNAYTRIRKWKKQNT